MSISSDDKYVKIYLRQLQAAFHEYIYRLCYLGNSRGVTSKEYKQSDLQYFLINCNLNNVPKC